MVKSSRHGTQPQKLAVELTLEQVALLRDALDSHTYWQLTPEEYRKDGGYRIPDEDESEEAGAARKGIADAEALDDLLREVEKNVRWREKR